MIAFSSHEKCFLLTMFPEHCLKATPDSEFLSNLYGFDMSLCPYHSLAAYPSMTKIFKEKLDVINSSSRMPELFVWMKSQVCPTIIIVLLILNDFIAHL